MSIFFWCAKENARKRKAHEPFPLDTRPLCRNTNLLSLKKQLGTYARKLAFAQTVRACAVGFAARPLAALRKFRRLRCGLWRLVLPIQQVKCVQMMSFYRMK